MKESIIFIKYEKDTEYRSSDYYKRMHYRLNHFKYMASPVNTVVKLAIL